jgi:hypothetical protein
MIVEESTVGFGGKLREAIDLRGRLRRVISNSLPGVSTVDAYRRLKAPFAEFMVQEDLFPFCEAVHIETSKLPLLLSPYGVFNSRIILKQWEKFYEDQFGCSHRVLPIPKRLTAEQQKILRAFANAVRARCKRDLPTQWQLIAKRNPSGTQPSQMRFSAICHLVQELSLKLDPRVLVDALLGFVGKRVEFFDFAQFANFMQTFD